MRHTIRWTKTRSWAGWARQCSQFCLVIALAVLPAAAQPGLLGSPGDTRPELPNFDPILRDPGTILPRIPLPDDQSMDGLSAGVRVYIESYRFSGNSVFTDAELAQVAQPYVGREVGFSDLEALRQELTRRYIDEGYLTSGALIFDQTIDDGSIEILLVEGSLGAIEIDTDGRLRAQYLAARLRRSVDDPVNVFQLEERLQILQQDSKILGVQAALLPGDAPGSSVLKIRVAEARPYSAALEFSNYYVPSTGSVGGRIGLAHSNVAGFGDSLNASYRGTEGLDSLDVRYEIPLNSYDTSLGAHIRFARSDVVEEPFARLDIESQAETYGLSLRQPVYRSVNANLELSIIGEYRRSDNLLLGSGFSFSPGLERGAGRIFALRVGAAGSYRTRRHVLAFHSSLSWGLDAFDATRNRGAGTPDGQFLKWLGQFQWATRLHRLRDSQLVARFDIQLANHPLLGMEQFAIGGHSTVRGYRENTLVRDNGMIGSLEVRVPIWRPSPGAPSILELVPFVDVGYASLEDRTTRGPRTLLSVGLGARLSLSNFFDLRVDWGYPLKDVIYGGEWDLQDSGVHMSLKVRLP